MSSMPFFPSPEVIAWSLTRMMVAAPKEWFL
jgi:hypothetical protein